MTMAGDGVEGGFADPVRDAAAAFRVLMTAMARPGEIACLTVAAPPAPLSVAAGAALLTLCDPETPLWLAPSHDTGAVRAWIAFQTGAPLTGPAGAVFAVGRWDEMPVADFPVGTPDFPDRSTTLIAELPRLANDGTALRGPGIAEMAHLSLPDVSALRQARFPLGLDAYLTCGDRLAALPRSTRVGPAARNRDAT